MSSPPQADARSRAHTRERDVAVVIVTYKSAALTIDCLGSLAKERSAAPGLSIRAVVVDNASGDLAPIAGAVEAAGWSSWVTLVAAPRNGGFAYGNNLGIERAYAAGIPAYVYLLNPDTLVRPGAITTLVRFLDTHPEVGIAGSSFEDGAGQDWPNAFRFPSLLGEINEGLKFGLVTRLLARWNAVRRMGNTDEQVDWVCGASMMLRPRLLEIIGGLDENYFLYFEETDFCWRARRAGFATWYVPGSRVMHIGGQSTAVTSGNAKRLPGYWFESRRRYYAVTRGLAQAMLIDVAAVIAYSLGALKALLQGRRREQTPHFIRDLAHHSILWKRNRDVPPVRTRIMQTPAGSPIAPETLSSVTD